MREGRARAAAVSAWKAGTFAGLCLSVVLCAAPLAAQPQTMWTTAWAASVQGPYPAGNVSLPTRLEQVFPVPASGARNQSFRLIVRPDVWGPQARLRLSNAFGTRAVTFDDVFVGVQLSGAAVMKGTNAPVLFGGRTSVTLAPGTDAWSDAVVLRTEAAGAFDGRKLAVSFHVAGEAAR